MVRFQFSSNLSVHRVTVFLRLFSNNQSGHLQCHCGGGSSSSCGSSSGSSCTNSVIVVLAHRVTFCAQSRVTYLDEEEERLLQHSL